MSLSVAEVAKFATMAVESDPALLAVRNRQDRHAKLLATCRSNATGYYAVAQADIRQSGYRLTRRVKGILWRTLKHIERRQIAPIVLPRAAVSNLAMTAGNEKKYSKVICDGLVKQWVGIGWVDEGEPSETDVRELPLVED